MLPSDLLVARARGGFVYPLYSRFLDHELYIADQLIEVFRSNVGRERGKLENDVKEIESEAFKIGCDYRFARGLAHLLYRRANFTKPEVKVSPLKARLEIFTEVSRRFGGFTLSEEEKREVLNVVARRLGLSVEDLITAFRAAYEDKEILESFNEISAEELLKLYNLSLTQTLLFKALYLIADVRISGTDAKILLFNVKKLGLMYVAEKTSDGIRLYIDGPASILKQTERYGTRIAEVLPYIMAAREWKISAKVRRRGRTYKFYITNKLSYLFPKIELRRAEYDSTVEEVFHKRFQTLGSGWDVEREPEPLVAGKSIFIPDFAFVKGNLKVYLEIVGFWTRGYLERKLKKLKELKDVNMILAVNERLACSKISALGYENIIYFKDKLSAPEVYIILRKYEGVRLRPKVRRRQEEVPSIPSEVEEFLNRLRVAKLSSIVSELEKYGLSVSQIVRILEDKGFKVEWKGISLDSVIVRKTSD